MSLSLLEKLSSRVVDAGVCLGGWMDGVTSCCILRS